MARLIELLELLRRLEEEGGIPSEVEKEVEAACKEAQRDIRTTLRDECRLQLRKPEIEIAEPPRGPAYIRVPVKILPGCPAGVAHVAIDTSTEAIKEALLLASHRDDLEKIATGGPGASELHKKLLAGHLLNLSSLPSLDPSGIEVSMCQAA